MLILTGILIIIIFAGGFFVYNDARDMQKNFETSENLFLFESANITSGFQTNPNGEPYLLNIDDLESVNSYYPEDLNKIKADNYKLIILNKKAFDSVESINLNNKTYSKEFAFALLDSETPVDDYFDDILIREGIPQEQREKTKQQIKSDFKYSNEEFKAQVFASLFQNRLDSEGPVYLFKQYKSGNAVIYKETAVFKMIRLIPTSFLKSIIQKSTTAVKEKIKSKIK